MKKLDIKGFSAAVSLGIVCIVVCVAGAGLYVYKSNKKSEKPSTASQQNAQAQSDTKSGESQVSKDPTSNWVIYKDAGGLFELKHPASWVVADRLELCTPSLLLIGANKDAVGRCGSDSGGQMSVFAQAGDQSNAYALTQKDYPDVKTELARVNGAIGVKQSGTYQPKEESMGLGPQPGDKIVVYALLKDNVTYVAQYNIRKINPYPDVQADFETMVKQTLKFKQ